MNALDPRSAYELSMNAIDERLERLELERELRAAGPKGFLNAFRHQLSAMLERLSEWVHPGCPTEPAAESALIRLAR